MDRTIVDVLFRVSAYGATARSPAIIVIVSSYSLLNKAEMLDWNDLRYFLAVAEAGTSAGAARILKLSQPTVVRRIAALEDKLRLPLFDRHANGYRITPHGEALLPSVQAIAGEIASLEEQARARARSGEKVIRLTMPEVAVASITPLLPRFRERYPLVRVELRSDDNFMDLLKGEADVAVRAGYNIPMEGLAGTRLPDVGWALYASPDYIDRHGLPRAHADLPKHAIIGAEGKLALSPPFQWLESHCGSEAIVWRGNLISAILSAARAGLGIAPLPCEVAINQPGIEAVTKAITELRGEFWVLTRMELKLDPAVKHLVALIAERFGEQAGPLSGSTIRLRDENGLDSV